MESTLFIYSLSLCYNLILSSLDMLFEVTKWRSSVIFINIVLSFLRVVGFSAEKTTAFYEQQKDEVVSRVPSSTIFYEL